ncbi:MAG: PAS domain-containing protein [Deltaproteobacteria bacterium]|nr:PAS domain-containing protein [Deltaproteobacteria bacterium]
MMPTEPSFPIVGIGAAAGAAALEAFFSRITDAWSAAFVVIEGSTPDQPALAPDRVRRLTPLEVVVADDATLARPDCVFLAPPGHTLVLRGGVFDLRARAAAPVPWRPIDVFFRSLASERGASALCVVLSGTGTDGTEGMRAVKSAGGLVIAQSPATAEHGEMPESAIATGQVDHEVAPADMAALLSAHVLSGGRAPPRERDGDAMDELFAALRAATGHDFSHYKPSTLRRRIERRMAAVGVTTVAAYAERVRGSRSEADLAFHDLLIGVTSFFRDPEAFHALEAGALSALLADKSDDAPVRAWSVGCSTGEEAYSLAIVLAEQARSTGRRLRIQVFATDVDERSIAVARAGRYPARIAASLSRERLERFFSLEPDGSYRVSKALREMLVFSDHDVLSDPPFSRLDVVVCRNLLIYVDTSQQRKMFELFHFALRPRGILFLGSSESVGELDDAFVAIDRASKLYRRRDSLDRHTRAPFTSASPLSHPPASAARPDAEPPTLRERMEAALLDASPPSALVDSLGEILYLHGRAGLFLEPMPGEVRGSNILSMARDGLRSALEIALAEAVRTHGEAVRRDVRVRTHGDVASVDVRVHPLAATAAPMDRPLFLVVLAARGGDDVPPAPTEMGAASQVAELERELAAKDQLLSTTRIALERSIRELSLTNEELQSANEELQSTNEELETSQEELHSLNDELTAVNTDLQQKIVELSNANDDLDNLLAGTGIATLFLDLGLRILRYTPTLRRIIQLIPADVGRPVAHLAWSLVGYDELVSDVHRVLDTLVPCEREVQSRDGCWFTLRILPYRTRENVIAGAVITFVDVTEIVRVREALRRATHAERSETT